MAKVLQKTPKPGQNSSVDAGPLLEAVAQAHAETETLLSPEHFRDTIGRLAAAISGKRTEAALYGSSEAGQALAGAIAFSEPRFELWTPGAAETVILVDGVIAGVAGLELAADRVRALGALDVEALVIEAIGVMAVDLNFPVVVASEPLTQVAA